MQDVPEDRLLLIVVTNQPDVVRGRQSRRGVGHQCLGPTHAADP